MNYRHGYHAGNFADVMKHVALVTIIAGCISALARVIGIFGAQTKDLSLRPISS